MLLAELELVATISLTCISIKQPTMKNILYTLALLISFSSFGQLYSYGYGEYYLDHRIIDFSDYPLVHQDDWMDGLPKKYLMKEFKCKNIKDFQKEMESIKWHHELNYSEYVSEYYDDYVEIKEDIIPIVVSFDVSVAGNITNVKGNSIQDSSIAKNLLHNAKVGDVVTLSNVKVVLGKGSKSIINIDSFYTFEITE